MKKWNIGWGPIAECNMHCQFCYSRRKRQEGNNLTIADWLHFIDGSGGLINTINYGTGENTLSMDWFSLISYIRKKFPEIRQSLTTNGHLSEAVKDNICMQSFLESIDEVDVSLDFCQAESHNAFRGQSKAFDWVIETLKICQYYGKTATIVFLGSEENANLDNIDGLFSIAEKYGAILRMNIYRPTAGLTKLAQKFIIKWQTLLSVLEHIAKFHRVIAIDDPFLSSYLTGRTVKDPSGNDSLRILADGSITPSTYLVDKKYVVGNIKEKNVLSQLSNDDKLADIVSRLVPNECHGCIYADSCAGGVLDRRWLWYGTLARRDPYCPGIIKKSKTNKISVTTTNFCSVHDGYLPTIFFKPGKED